MAVCENCSTVKVVKMLLVLCVSLVILQYFVNLTAYSYVSKIFRDAQIPTIGFNMTGRFNVFAGGASTGADNRTSTTNNSVVFADGGSVKTVLEGNGTGLCPAIPPNLVGALQTYSDVLPFEDLKKHFPDVKPGGRYKPPHCTSRHRVAIIVPYRDREWQLKTFLYNMHSLLGRQELDYAIYVVEPELPTVFNRALMMNIGYVEALKDYNFQCFIFHDVDLIPEHDKNLYNCPESPRHMSVAINTHNYKLPYATIFGGVSALSKEQMEKINGFSNRYFGWGGEDDDLWKRIKQNGYKLIRPPIEYARYRMIKHGKDTTNAVNKERFKLLYSAEKRMKIDGLNSLKYELVKKEYRPLYTWVLAKVNQKELMA